MGFSYRYRYSVEMVLARGAMTPIGWDVKSSRGRRGPVRGLGQPNAANLARYMADYNASLQPGGVNAHLGLSAIATSARILDHDNDRAIVATWRLDEQPKFMVINPVPGPVTADNSVGYRNRTTPDVMIDWTTSRNSRRRRVAREYWDAFESGRPMGSDDY